jgi:deoxyribodipyrimidine photolyase-related protein
MEVSLVFPHQLYKNHPAIATLRPVWLIEDELYFRQYPFHKQKILLHRASMRFYEQYLKSLHHQVEYIECISYPTLETVFVKLKEQHITSIHYTDTTDYLLERRLKRLSKKYGIQLILYESPNFICSKEFIDSFFAKKKRYFQTEFYIELRKQKNILIENENPTGGQWTYDSLNRKKLPKSAILPTHPHRDFNLFHAEAKKYIEQHFSDHYGTADSFNYPISFTKAESALDSFLHERFNQYGDYQDAIEPTNSFLFHSILTPALNIGLLTPEVIINKALHHFKEKNIPLNSAEGFIRQVLGWREFIRAVYIREGTKERLSNHWNHTRKIPASFYSGTTGIEPVDSVIKRLLTTGYSNHIERLMILGNFMLLCEFHPDEVYRWFMELYIDAYDWVMVPNVYGMSQFADGGLMATKPYISSSNYILKMSSYKKGEWCEVWDALYWRFISNHQEQFSKNPRMSMMVVQLNKMDDAKRTRLEKIATTYLNSLA